LFVVKRLSLLFRHKLLGKMTKQDHINYWLNTANDNWADVQRMFKARSYVPCLFFTHLVFEKLAKALWVKHNVENMPPKIHNINMLLQQAHIEISAEEQHFFSDLNRFQMENRYPDYSRAIHHATNRKVTKEILESDENHRLDLLNLLIDNVL
jgi:HEPN domain-containing protein